MASKFFKNYANRILLDNCGIDDRQFSKILESFANLQDFKSIIYRNNEFSTESAIALRKLLTKKFPYHLEEL
jgi:hypothetical protein